MSGTKKPFSKYEWWTAGAVAAVALAVFAKTVQTTVPFWDCGEFIACSYILGVTHPPGAPIFVMIGRLFSLLPFGSVPHMVNWVSVLSSALAAGAAALVAMLLVKRAIGEAGDSPWAKRAVIVAGWAGGLLTAFSDSFWFNAVEAEVYGLTLLMMLLITLLVLLWYERRGSGFAYRALALSSYIAFLGIAVHMTVFLMMPAVFVLVIATDKTLRADPRFWVAGVALGTVMFSIDVFGILVGALIVLMVGIGLMSRARARGRWGFAAALLVASAVGYTSQLYIPIRSTCDPGIDQNDPETWAQFRQFLERKQYSQDSMFKMMFTRRGEFSNQIGTHARLGFWGFFMGQYTPKDPWWAHLIPTALGFTALWWLVRRTPARGAFMGLLFVICSLGLVLYINMSDGTHGTITEVRDRDYIFSPAYVAFAILVGVGFGRIIAALARRAASVGKAVLRPVAAAVACIAVASPVVPALTHYHTHDRTGNSIAWDYAYNLLNSCDEDGIIFTNGDNDTFPVWYIQQVDSVRNDVRVVNLSLVNVDWYILQMKNEWKNPIRLDLTDEQIRWHPQRLRDGRVYSMPSVPYVDRRYGEPPVQRILTPYMRQDGVLVRVQDAMIREIIRGNKWAAPVYLSVTVSSDNKKDAAIGLPISQHMVMEGMVDRVVRDSVGPGALDVARMEEVMLERNQYRGLSDPRVYKDENAVRLIENYISGFLRIVTYHVDHGDAARAHEVSKRATELYPPSWRAWYMRHLAAAQAGDTVDAEFSIVRAIEEDPGQAMFFDRWLALISGSGRAAEKRDELRRAFDSDGRDWISGAMAAMITARESGPATARPLLDTVIDRNPGLAWGYLYRFVITQDYRSPGADLSDLKRAYEMSHSQPVCYMLLDALRVQGRSAEATDLSEDWLSRSTDDAAVWGVWSQLTGKPMPSR